MVQGTTGVDKLRYFLYPAEIVGKLAVLDPREGIIEFLGQGANLAIGDGQAFVFVANGADRGYHRCSAAAEGFLDLA